MVLGAKSHDLRNLQSTCLKLGRPGKNWTDGGEDDLSQKKKREGKTNKGEKIARTRLPCLIRRYAVGETSFPTIVQGVCPPPKGSLNQITRREQKKLGV